MNTFITFSFPDRRQLLAVALLLFALTWMRLPADSVSITTNAAPLAAKTPSTPATNAGGDLHGVTITAKIGDDDDQDDSSGKSASRSGDRGIGSYVEDMIIPLVGIVATFGMPIAIVFLAFYFSHRRRQETLATVREFLNKGQPVPPELLESLGSKYAAGAIASVVRRRSDQSKGFKLSFIGLGVALALYFSDPRSTMWAWGLIPMVMGLGYLVSGWVQSRDRSPQQDDLPPRPGGPSAAP